MTQLSRLTYVLRKKKLLKKNTGREGPRSADEEEMGAAPPVEGASLCQLRPAEPRPHSAQGRLRGRRHGRDARAKAGHWRNHVSSSQFVSSHFGKHTRLHLCRCCIRSSVKDKPWSESFILAVRRLYDALLEGRDPEDIQDPYRDRRLLFFFFFLLL